MLMEGLRWVLEVLKGGGEKKKEKREEEERGGEGEGRREGEKERKGGERGEGRERGGGGLKGRVWGVFWTDFVFSRDIGVRVMGGRWWKRVIFG